MTGGILIFKKMFVWLSFYHICTLQQSTYNALLLNLGYDTIYLYTIVDSLVFNYF
jgi:hypothetical protein